MADLSRRGFFVALAVAPVAVKALAEVQPQVEHAVWYDIETDQMVGTTFKKGDIFTIEGKYAINPPERYQQFVVTIDP